MLDKTIGFIGIGNMAAALISCICNKKIAKRIIASGKNAKNLDKLRKQFSIIISSNNRETVKNSDIVFICVKPQDMEVVLDEIGNAVSNQLIVSIAAGVKLNYLEKKLKTKRIIRVMPNINCLVGEMAAGFSSGDYATKSDVECISKILNSIGTAFLLKEDLLDAVGAISGSGPAFFAYFVKSFEEAGVKNGLKKDIAHKLATKTALGAAKMMTEKNLQPDELIQMVASKKGITIAGLNNFKKYRLNQIIIKTVGAAIKRSKEMAK